MAVPEISQAPSNVSIPSKLPNIPESGTGSPYGSFQNPPGFPTISSSPPGILPFTGPVPKATLGSVRPSIEEDVVKAAHARSQKIPPQPNDVKIHPKSTLDPGKKLVSFVKLGSNSLEKIMEHTRALSLNEVAYVTIHHALR